MDRRRDSIWCWFTSKVALKMDNFHLFAIRKSRKIRKTDVWRRYTLIEKPPEKVTWNSYFITTENSSATWLSERKWNWLRVETPQSEMKLEAFFECKSPQCISLKPYKPNRKRLYKIQRLFEYFETAKIFESERRATASVDLELFLRKAGRLALLATKLWLRTLIR